jgi:DNA-binding NtrC family response regulator
MVKEAVSAIRPWRREDIPELVEHFLTSRQIGPTRYRIEPQALEALARYGWPGNVRELANVIERAQILAEHHLITPDDLPETLTEAAVAPADDEDPDHLRAVERRHMTDVLRREQGNKVRAAKPLGISRRALYRIMSKYHVDSTPAGGKSDPD